MPYALTPNLQISVNIMLNQKSFNYPGEYFERLHATSLDDQDPLRELRKEFIIPSKDDLEGKNLAKLGISRFLSFVLESQ